MTTTTLGATAPAAGAAGVPAVRLAGVTKDFAQDGQSVHAVRGIDLELAQGEVVAILGPNGAGKTTTIDMVLGLSQPTSGEVSVLGLQPRAAIARGLVSAVMQTGGLLKDLTVRETVRYTASLFADTEDVDTVLATAGIAGIADRKVGKCSGGEQQRLRFAMALLPDPALLLLDEPTTGMDVEGRRTFWAAIRADAARGRTVVFATHYNVIRVLATHLLGLAPARSFAFRVDPGRATLFLDGEQGWMLRVSNALRPRQAGIGA